MFGRSDFFCTFAAYIELDNEKDAELGACRHLYYKRHKCAGVDYTMSQKEYLVRTDELIIKNLKTNKVLQISQRVPGVKRNGARPDIMSSP